MGQIDYEGTFITYISGPQSPGFFLPREPNSPAKIVFYFYSLEW